MSLLIRHYENTDFECCNFFSAILTFFLCLISAAKRMANIKNREASLKLGQTNSKCARCGKTVYFAEQVFGAGKKWHKQCFKCVECNKSVSSSSLRDKDGKSEDLVR